MEFFDEKERLDDPLTQFGFPNVDLASLMKPPAKQPAVRPAAAKANNATDRLRDIAESLCDSLSAACPSVPSSWPRDGLAPTQADESATSDSLQPSVATSTAATQ